jgi:hypothetical protein
MRSRGFGLIACWLVIASVVLGAACGGDDDGEGETDAPAAASADEVAEGAPDDAPEGENGDDSAPAQQAGDRGSATLTIGEQTWTFDSYYCATGARETRNDRVSFSSGATGSPDGVRLQLDASIQDPSEEDRLEGDGVIHSVTLNDIEDFENPTAGWSAVSGIVGESNAFIQVSDGRVTAEAVFDDELTDGVIEEVPGTLEATCPSRGQ